MKNNRSVFEDVDTNKKQFLTGGVIDQGRGGARYSICIWLLMLFFLVIIMIMKEIIDYFYFHFITMVITMEYNIYYVTKINLLVTSK